MWESGVGKEIDEQVDNNTGRRDKDTLLRMEISQKKYGLVGKFVILGLCHFNCVLKIIPGLLHLCYINIYAKETITRCSFSFWGHSGKKKKLIIVNESKLNPFPFLSTFFLPPSDVLHFSVDYLSQSKKKTTHKNTHIIQKVKPS